MSSFAHRRVIKGDQYLLMATFNHGKGSTSFMARFEVLVTAASMPRGLCAAVVGQRSGVGITRHLGRSLVNHRSCTPCRLGCDTAPEPSFARRIGWRETEFAQQYAQRDIHLHVSERRADAAVDTAAERN